MVDKSQMQFLHRVLTESMKTSAKNTNTMYHLNVPMHFADVVNLFSLVEFGFSFLIKLVKYLKLNMRSGSNLSVHSH